MLDDEFGDDELDPVVGAVDELEARADEFLAGQDGGRFSIAEQGAVTFSLFPVLGGGQPVAAGPLE